jgi:hypothetical protein
MAVPPAPRSTSGRRVTERRSRAGSRKPGARPAEDALVQGPDAPPLFSKRGGARIGRSFWLSASYGWPLARLDVFEDRIELRLFGAGAIRLPRAAISAVRIERGLFATRFRFEHQALREQRYVRFAAFDGRETRETLRRLGFPVLESATTPSACRRPGAPPRCRP